MTPPTTYHQEYCTLYTARLSLSSSACSLVSGGEKGRWTEKNTIQSREKSPMNITAMRKRRLRNSMAFFRQWFSRMGEEKRRVKKLCGEKLLSESERERELGEPLIHTHTHTHTHNCKLFILFANTWIFISILTYCITSTVTIQGTNMYMYMDANITVA